LSTGAIVGIVIGCLVGVGLIAGLVYYFVTKGGDDKDTDYTAGQSGGSIVSGTQIPKTEETIQMGEDDRVWALLFCYFTCQIILEENKPLVIRLKFF
jgi:hypothetical protein